MHLLSPSMVPVLLFGVGLGVVGFAPMFVTVRMVRSGRIKPSLSKGMAAFAVSLVVSAAAFVVVMLVAPRDILVIAIGFLVGFQIMWAVLAALTMSR